MPLRVVPATLADAGELLTVQLAAFVGEAERYGEFLPPLRDTLQSVRDAIRRTDTVVLKVVDGHRIVGAGRMEVAADTATLGRLCVVPDRQGEGIGSLIIRSLEAAAPQSVTRFAMFTGDKSTSNLDLYRRLGYLETSRRTAGTHSLVDLSKPR